MKQRIITGLAITAVVLPAFLYGGLPFKILVFLFIAFGVFEAYAIKKDHWPLWIYALMSAVVLLMSNVNLEILFVSFLILLMGLYTLSVLFPWFSSVDVSYIFSILFLFTGALRAVLMVVNIGRLELIYILVVTYLTDSGAYFAGYLFGKHKLNERISPKKTIEGAIGGWLIGTLLGIGYAYLWIDKLNFNFMIMASMVLPFFAQLGDLSFSSIKRYFGIKDFGTLFPAHGGVLDRIDSLLFSLLAFFILLVIAL